MAGVVARTAARIRTVGVSASRFARQVMAELRRVVWPDRRQAAVFTAVVVAAVAITALLIAVVDAIVIRLLALVLE